MAESACLLRSYSNPSSSSPGTEQGDPFRCLTSSKSFGRYESDSLNWEKFSAFTENRVMEDVKKYSKPGSVARMKAYFEAYYKKQAADRAAALAEKLRAINAVQVYVARGEIHEEEGERAPKDVQIVAAVENQLVKNVEDVQILVAEEKQLVENVDNVQGSVITSDQVDECGLFKSVEVKNTQRKAIPASLAKRKSVFSPFKSRGPIGVPKAPVPPKRAENIRNIKANSGSDVKSRKLATKSLHLSINLSPKETKKTPVSPILRGLVNSKLVKTLAGKAAHAIQGKPLQGTVDISPHPQQKKSISSLRSPRAFTRNVQSPTVSCPFSFRSEERAAKRKEFFERLEQNAKAKEKGKDKLQEKSKVITKRKEFFERSQQNAKAKEIEKDKPREKSKVISPKRFEQNANEIEKDQLQEKSKFCERLEQNAMVEEIEKVKQRDKSKVVIGLKSEERAAKRKEFFERLEQRSDFKYMPVLGTSKVGPCPDSFRTRRTTNDASKAIIPEVSGETLKDNTNRPSWRQLKAGCKDVRGKPNPSSPTFPLKSVMKKYTRENASPTVELC